MNSPDKDIAEVTLIGTGGGYGESCIIHLGDNNWIVVDSCINPHSGESLPLEYLKNIGVDLSQSVKYVICTHWHDDHILGISKLYAECLSAKFCIADVTDLKKFLYSVSLDSEKLVGPISLSSTNEFNKCFDITQKRKGTIKKASKNKVIFTVNFGDQVSSIISLSPSDYSVAKFDQQISTLITEYGPNKKIVPSTPNINSIALFLKLGIHRAILGADLEVGANNKEGWLNILDDHEGIFDSKSTLFKISHHGSQNGYDKRIWSEVLNNNPVAKLTPWNRKEKLPLQSMIDTYNGHTDKLYITSDITLKPKAKNRDSSAEKLIGLFNPTLKEVKFQKGIIRCRIPLFRESEWEVTLFEGAKLLSK